MLKSLSFLIGSALLLATAGFAQNVAPPVSVDLMLTSATLGKGISPQNRDLIDRQLLSLFSDGEGVNSKYSAFLVQPALDLLEQTKIEGVQNRQAVKLNLSLKLTHSFSGEALDVRDVTLTGAGAGVEEAMKKAITSIRRTHPALSKTLGEFRQKVVDYYAKDCAAVLASAEQAVGRSNFREAFALLHSVPQGVACFHEVAGKKGEYFQKSQETDCASHLAKASAAEANNDFAGALAILSRVDAAAPCFDQARQAVAAIEPKVDEHLKMQYEWLFKFYSEGKEAEAARWNAMSALYLAWLKESGKFTILNQ